MSRPHVVLHASDLQCGRPYAPRAGDAFVAFAHALAPDAIVISGDLTQRAKTKEYRAAVQLMERLPDVPKILTPGNHDVPLFRAWERALMPYKNWRAFISRELDTVTRVEGATYVALNSSAPRSQLVNGRVRGRQLDFARRAFDAAPPGDIRALVVHHHFVPTPDGSGGRILPAAREIVMAFEAMGVDLVLGGHVHRTHVSTSRDVVAGEDEGIPLIACGTTTSHRGRGPERGINSLNVVRVHPREVEVHPHVLGEVAHSFQPAERIVMARRGNAEVSSGGSSR